MPRHLACVWSIGERVSFRRTTPLRKQNIHSLSKNRQDVYDPLLTIYTHLHHEQLEIHFRDLRNRIAVPCQSELTQVLVGWCIAIAAVAQSQEDIVLIQA